MNAPKLLLSVAALVGLWACDLAATAKAPGRLLYELGFPGPPLGSGRLVKGKLISNEDGACRKLPTASCGYENNGYEFYYDEGILFSKKLVFKGNEEISALGLSAKSKITDVKQALYSVEGKHLSCAKIEMIDKCWVINRNNRLDFEFKKQGFLKSIEISLPEDK